MTAPIVEKKQRGLVLLLNCIINLGNDMAGVVNLVIYKKRDSSP